jgi:hypothetical protein
VWLVRAAYGPASDANAPDSADAEPAANIAMKVQATTVEHCS